MCFGVAFNNMGTNDIYAYSLIYNTTVTTGPPSLPDIPDTRTANSDNFTIDSYKT
jgi:hypothetical protein